MQQTMPPLIAPMLAKTGKLPANVAEYGFEYKWDGYRAICYLDKGKISVVSRNLRDITWRCPELQLLGEAYVKQRLVLDGEIVALTEETRPSFALLQRRMSLQSKARIRHLAQQIPITFMAFDVLFIDGQLLLDQPYTERRRRLAALEVSGSYWQTSPYWPGVGQGIITASKQLGLEGVVAKKLDSPYEPGKRSGAWLKIKNIKRQELVIGGWLPMTGHAETVGAILVGYYENDKLIYAGKVGTGFPAPFLARLREAFSVLQRPDSPFATKIPYKKARFVEPVLVAEVEFTEWTPQGTLRHPAFKGLRPDKDPRDVVREDL